MCPYTLRSGGRDIAEYDLIVDLGDGRSVFYAEGSPIPVEHRDQPRKAADYDDHGGIVAAKGRRPRAREPRRSMHNLPPGDLAPDRLVDG